MKTTIRIQSILRHFWSPNVVMSLPHIDKIYLFILYFRSVCGDVGLGKVSTFPTGARCETYTNSTKHECILVLMHPLLKSRRFHPKLWQNNKTFFVVLHLYDIITLQVNFWYKWLMNMLSQKWQTKNWTKY